MTRADFFISFAQSDRAWAEWIAWKLKEAGYATVVQAWDSTPGSDWASEMERATTSARKTIAVLSSAYLQSGYGEAEWRVAFASDPTGERRLVMPVRVEDIDPPGPLRTRVYIDLVGLSEADAAARLLEDISRDRDKSEQPRFPGLAAAARRAVPPPFPGSGRDLTIDIVPGDVITFYADFLVAFKYAQDSYGSDRQAAEALAKVGIDAATPCDRRLGSIA